MGATEITPPSSIRIGETRVGRGVIAVRDIAEGETIEVVPLLVVEEADSDGVLADYVVDPGDGTEGAVVMLGYGSLYNHSEDPNAEYIQHAEDAYEFAATRDIAAGEEVTVSYSERWWQTRGLEPE